MILFFVVVVVVGIYFYSQSKKDMDTFKRKELSKTDMVKDKAMQYYNEMKIELDRLSMKNSELDNTITTLTKFPDGNTNRLPEQRVRKENYMSVNFASIPSTPDLAISVGKAKKLRAENATGRLGLTNLPTPRGPMWGSESILSAPDVTEAFKQNRGRGYT
jgi:hypothetical protein